MYIEVSSVNQIYLFNVISGINITHDISKLSHIVESNLC